MEQSTDWLNSLGTCLSLLVPHVRLRGLLLLLLLLRGRRSPRRLVVQEEPRVHVLGLADERVPAVVGVQVLGRDVGGGDEAPAQGLHDVEEQA